MSAIIQVENKSFRRQPLLDQYIALLESYAAFAGANGVPLIPYTPKSIQRFISLDLEKQQRIHSRLLEHYEICTSAIENNVDLNDNKHSLAWWAIRQMNLRPPSDLFQHLQPNDIVEIYNSDGVQIFRSFNFFRLCIYSLDHILTHEWHELYKRDEGITSEMLKMVGDLFGRQIQGVYYPHFPEHVVQQNLDGEMSSIRTIHRLVSPLHDKNNDVFLFNAFQVEKVVV